MGEWEMTAGTDGIWRSPNGLANNWKLVANTGPVVGGLVTDGVSLFASTNYFTNFGQPRYLRSSVIDGLTWTAMPNVPSINQGGTMAYDAGNHLLYSSNLTQGLWRVVVR
jgi:hypothetical protein